jgi:hypothetical protein
MLPPANKPRRHQAQAVTAIVLQLRGIHQRELRRNFNGVDKFGPVLSRGQLLDGCNAYLRATRLPIGTTAKTLLESASGKASRSKALLAGSLSFDGCVTRHLQ